MSMSTHVAGFKPPDEKWRQMKAVYDTCHAAGIDAPTEVLEFFNYVPPDDKGVRVEKESLINCGALEPWSARDSQGFQLVVAKLPADVKVVRFYNSW